MIVKFTSYGGRKEVFSRKKQLKGSGITIKEDLTSRRRDALKRAIELYGLRNVWSSDGKILFSLEGNIFTACCMEDVEKFKSKVCPSASKAGKIVSS